MSQVKETLDHSYKNHFGRMVAALLRSFRVLEPEIAEDIIHDAFSAALLTWTDESIPLNPSGWIYKVCRNKALNWIRKESKNGRLPDDFEYDVAESEHTDLLFEDYQLRLLFACAHPDLSPKVQVVITLKYVVNLRLEAIAKILAMSLDGVDKLLVRARQQIKEENILLQEPSVDLLKPRLNSVHKVLYLIFNEGYKSSSGKELTREDLCEEALITTRALLETPIATKETAALYSLMLFNGARLNSRFGTAGELLDLENQNRSTWNNDLIMLGCSYLRQSQSSDPSTYHLEASIACVHCNAPDFKSTDWNLISKLYSQLLGKSQNSFVELNYAISLYYAGDKDSAFRILHRIAEHPFFSEYYLLNAALGKLYLLEGEGERATSFLARAHRQTTFTKEKDFIQGLINSIS